MVVKVVLDTNIWIGLLLGSRNCRGIRDAFLDGLFDVLISPTLAEELAEVCKRDKFRTLFHESDVNELLRLLETDAEWVLPRSHITVCRDVKDNMILECAVAGKADFVVSGDDDLLCLSSFSGVNIVSPRQFLLKLPNK
jgi:uncharacterized protein